MVQKFFGFDLDFPYGQLVQSGERSVRNVFLEKFKLIVHGPFEVISCVDIKVVDGIVDDFGTLSLSLLDFPNDFQRKCNAFISYLKQDWAVYFFGMFNRMIFVRSNENTRAYFVNEIIWCDFLKSVPSASIG